MMMDILGTDSAIAALRALSQSTRLEIFRLLVRSRARLLTSQRYSRLIVYQTSLPRLRELMLFLVKDCHAGNSKLRAPLIVVLGAVITAVFANDGVVLLLQWLCCRYHQPAARDLQI